MKRVIMLLAVSLLACMSSADAKDTTRRVWVGKLNINTASAADFSVLPGIGDVTAHRIVKFREEIGGFKAVSELKRVKWVDEKLFLHIEPNLTLFDKSNLKVLIDINSASLQVLKALPGISEKEASSIIEYRRRNEGFKKIEDIPLAGIISIKYEEIKDMITVLPYVPLKNN